MKSLLENHRQSPLFVAGELGPDSRPLGEARWDWTSVTSVLVVRLRSIGDTVLATPSLFALRRFLPNARIDILLEDWVAPVLSGLDSIDRVIEIERGSTASRAGAVGRLRAARYDVAYNLHGGTTATLLTRASGARYRVGYADYQYGRLHNHVAPPSSELWGRRKTHSVEQQLALLGWTGVPVTDRPRTRLAITETASRMIESKLQASNVEGRFALIHPAAAFETKRWAADKFARVADYLADRGLAVVAITAPKESRIVEDMLNGSNTRIVSFTHLSLPEVTALAARSSLFVGNDSGIAHIAAAAGAPSVVIFGSSNIAHWSPWATGPAEIVREELPCQPCPGYSCAEFDEPECILRVPVERVTAAIDRVMTQS
jgi:heptosyltransferase-3